MEYEQFKRGIARLSWVLGIALGVVVAWLGYHVWNYTPFARIAYSLVAVGLVRGLGVLVAWIVKGFTRQPDLLEHREAPGNESKD